jgi:hypothetical protein
MKDGADFIRKQFSLGVFLVTTGPEHRSNAWVRKDLHGYDLFLFCHFAKEGMYIYNAAFVPGDSSCTPTVFWGVVTTCALPHAG